MQDTNTIRFFRELASRMYKENDLSDILYALCESNLLFKQFFLDFFFSDSHLPATETSIQREVQYSDGARPDFVLQYNSELFFVEVKIWDGSHHFAQYAKTLETENRSPNEMRKPNLAYITNYRILPESLTEPDKKVYEIVKERVTEWKDFIDALEKQGADPEARSWATGEDVQGFIEYCRRVCPATEFENVDSFIFDAQGFLFVRDFYNNLGAVLNGKLELGRSTRKMICVNRYSRGKFNNPGDWFGMYFSVSDLLKENEMVWGWIGCYLREGTTTPGLCIEFLNKNGWGSPVFKRLNLSSYQIDYCYSLNDTKEETIRAKLKEALQSVIDRKLPKHPETSSRIETPKQLKDMRRFGLFLEQNVLNTLFDAATDSRIEIIQGSDSQNPAGWCGVYFDVVTRAKDKEHESHELSRNRGWLGVYFDGRKSPIDGKTENGNRIVLEWKGATYLVGEVPNQVLDPIILKTRVSDLLEVPQTQLEEKETT